MNPTHLRRYSRAWLQACLLCATLVGSTAAQTSTSNSFLVHWLASDLPGVADNQDTNLVNPWGNGFGNSPFWVANNGTGTSTLYNGYGVKNAAITVNIPAANGATTPGPVTGAVSNMFSASVPTAFVIASPTPGPASFIFCSLDGLITAWNGSVGTAAGVKALVVVDNSKSGAVYTGCTVGGTTAAPMFYAANFASGKVEAYDATFKPVTTATFANPTVTTAGMVAYNVQSFGGKLYVTYATPNAAKTNVAIGAGNGAVAVFDFNGNLIGGPIIGGPLNAPWGVVIAPSTWGSFAGALLVGNFGDGKINAFNATTGASIAALDDSTGNPIVIPGLWSLAVGSGAQSEDPGTVYFTAGIGGGANGAATATAPIQSHGLLGSIQYAPDFLPTGNLTFLTFNNAALSVPSGILNGASLLPSPLAPNTWTTIKGSDLSPVTGTWKVSGATLPTTLSNVSVTINNEPAFVEFVGNQQINFLTPSDLQVGSTPKIVVTSNGLTSAAVSSSVVQASPAFFTIGTGTSGQNYVAALHVDGTLIGPTTLKGTGANGGETISLYGTGFGTTTTSVANGQISPTPQTLSITPTVTIEGMVAKVTYAGVVSPGLVQINVVVPTGLPAGDALVVATLDNSETQLSAYITVTGQ